MEHLAPIVKFFQDNWIQIVAIGWALEKLLELVATLTPWKWDDNLGVILGKILSKISGRMP